MNYLSYSAVVRLSAILSVILTFTLVLWFIAPNALPYFPFNLTLLALGAVSSVLNIYKFTTGYGTSETMNIMAATLVLMSSRNRTGLTHEDTVQRLTEIKNAIDMLLEHA
ncbi:MAG: hypothetical protein WB643_07660 [Candidatus Bathyarchaeia archaeon]